MKKHGLTIFIVLLLLVGLGVLLYPTMSDWYVRWTLSKEIGNYNAVMEGEGEDFSALWEEAEAYNQSLLGKDFQFAMEDGEQEYVETLLNPMGNGMMGYIDIEKIGVHLPVFQGTDETMLQSGAGWWLGSSLPTGGKGTHCIITAHTGLVKAKLFTDIDRLEVGDTFSLSVLDRDMYYVIDQVVIVEPDEIEELLIDPEQDYVTLYTCYPYGVNTQRLLVRGVRTQPPAVEQVTPAETETDWLWIAILAVCLLLALLILLLILLLRRKKRRAEDNQGNIKETNIKETNNKGRNHG